MGGIARMFGGAGPVAAAVSAMAGALLLAGAASAQAPAPGAPAAEAPAVEAPAVEAPAVEAPAAEAGPMERCFGTAPAGQNGGVGLGGDTAKSTVDYQGDAWSMVPRGACQTMALPVQPDGTPRRGAIRPLDRDPG